MANSAFTPTVLQSFQDASISQPGLVNTTTQSFAGDKTFTGNLNVVGNGRGIVPLGAIIAMTTGISGAMAVPASGSASFGWQRADGAAIAGGSTLSGTTPNLSTSVFLRGATTYGGAGGGTATLIAANIPSISSTGTTGGGSVHSHGSGTLVNAASGVSGSVGGGDGTHTHTISDPGHVHTCPAWGVGANAANVASAQNSFFNTNDTTSAVTGISVNATNSGHGHGFSLTAAAQAISGATASESAHTHSVTVTSTGTSGTAFNVVPNYIDVIYLMRVA
jgi:hypothetical protein